MLKFFYRLKRRHGVVLFAVIAIMTLLIAMATTAYFTARASYQTVVSNYDFSQTYLSAISISDMLIEAVTQDTSHPGADNNYTALKTAVQNLRDNKTAGAADAVITGFTVHNGAAATDANILTEAASDPVEAGIFDAAKVEIRYIKKEADKNPITNVETGLTRHYFTFTTTVYYRDTTITVQDTIINKNGTISSSDAAPFSRFFTGTSQTTSGKDVGDSRVVIIDTKNISDDSYFENEYTLIGFAEHAGNSIDGSIISSGSVYLYQMDTSGMPATTGSNRNDWFIGNDLVITRNASNIDLKGSNLYIGGDLIIGRDGGSNIINAANIYVKGNIYYLNGASGSINGNVYLGGSVIGAPGEANSRVSELDALLASQGFTSNISPFGTGNTGVFGYHLAGAWDDSTPITISNQVISSDGHKYEETLVEGITLGDAFGQKTKKYDYATYTGKAETYENELNLNPGVLNMDTSIFKSNAELSDPETYNGHYYDSHANTNTVWGSSGKTEYNTTVTIEMTANADGTVTYTKTETGTATTSTYWPVSTTTETINKTETSTYTKSGSEITFNYDDGSQMTLNTSTNTARVDAPEGGGATIKKDGDRIVVDVDYTENGYLLGINDVNNDLITYNFNTMSGTTMPVVLKANVKDSSGTKEDANGNNAFSWCGDLTGRSDGKKDIVQLIQGGGGYGNVAFEVGNYTETDEGEIKYVPASLAGIKSNKITTATYYETGVLIIGTKDQCDYLKDKDIKNNPNLDGMLQSGTSYPQNQYKNHVMLISNKDNGTAITANTANGRVLCGYIYAPDGVYKTYDDQQKKTIFGGMIVSIYETKMTYFTYASPDPTDIASILSSMSSEEFGGTDTPTAGVWSLQEGKNYLG